MRFEYQLLKLLNNYLYEFKTIEFNFKYLGIYKSTVEEMGNVINRLI